MQSWHLAQQYTFKFQHQLWYVMAYLVSSSLKTGRLIFIWPPGSLWGCLPWHGCLESHNLSDIEDIDDEVNAVLLSLSNPWSDKSEGYQGGVTYNSHCLWPWFWPCCGAHPHSCCPIWGPSWGTSHHLAFDGRLAGHGDMSWLQKIKWHRCRCNGLRATNSPWFDVSFSDGWVINCLPSGRFTALVLICACLPTRAIIPDNVNVVSLTSPKFSPSSNEWCP